MRVSLLLQFVVGSTPKWRRITGLMHTSAVFSDFAAPLLDLSCGPWGWPEIFVSDTGQIFKNISGSELCILV